MHTHKTSTVDAANEAGSMPLDVQTIITNLSNFRDHTAAVAWLSQELAIHFALISAKLKQGGVIDADYLLARLSAAVVQAEQILEGALDLALLNIIPEEQWGPMN